MSGGFLPKRGGYRNLRAARSGKQNIAEESKASMTSTETEIKLTNVAKASLEELLLDYGDQLREMHLEPWRAGHPRFERLRAFCRSEELFGSFAGLLPKMSAEEIANMAITLINQATYMLRRLLERQQQMFLEQGGIREQMTRARLAYRGRVGRADRSDRSDQSD